MIARTLSAENRARDVDSLSRLLLALLPGVDLDVAVEPHKKERTVKQRSSLFGVAYASLMAQMGLRGQADKDALHRDFCGDYFGWVETKACGSFNRRPLRTTTTDENGNRDVIDTKRQLDFYAFIQQTAAGYGYDVPDPDPEWHRKAEREAELTAEAKRQAPVAQQVERATHNCDVAGSSPAGRTKQEEK